LKISAWRITKRKHAKAAFTGEGARLYGGRWNSPGSRVVYAAESQSLAVLEMLVHLDSAEILKQYVLFEIEIDASRIVTVDKAKLPRNWRADPAPERVRAIGDSWIATGASAVLRVPSALVPGESNFLLNPSHPDFARLIICKPLSFQFDLRLAGRKKR
jgi:RES domain-containing protein